MERSTMFNGKTHELSIAMFNSYVSHSQVGYLPSNPLQPSSKPPQTTIKTTSNHHKNTLSHHKTTLNHHKTTIFPGFFLTSPPSNDVLWRTCRRIDHRREDLDVQPQPRRLGLSEPGFGTRQIATARGGFDQRGVGDQRRLQAWGFD